jgi:hypothetical protein
VFFSCEAVDKGPESDALNDTANPDTFAKNCRAGVRCGQINSRLPSRIT